MGIASYAPSTALEAGKVFNIYIDHINIPLLFCIIYQDVVFDRPFAWSFCEIIIIIMIMKSHAEHDVIGRNLLIINTVN